MVKVSGAPVTIPIPDTDIPAGALSTWAGGGLSTVTWAGGGLSTVTWAGGGLSTVTDGVHAATMRASGPTVIIKIARFICDPPLSRV
jgi:hypothetical protein